MKLFKKGQTLTFTKQVVDILQNNNSNNSSSNEFFKPQLGENVLRILPYIHDSEGMWSFITVYTHWRINNENLISPKTFGGTDKFIDYASEIWNTEGLADDDKKAMFKRLMPNEYLYCPVIVRGEDETVIKLWRIPNSIKNTIFEFLRDTDTENMIDPYNGIDLVLTKVQTNPQDYKTISYSIRLKRKNSPVGTEDQMEKIFNLETFPKFENVWKVLPDDEYNKKFEDFINGDFKKITNPTENKTVESSSNSVDDTMNKFKQMVASD